MGTLGTAYYIGAASDGAECAYCSSHDGEITNFHDASFTALSLTCEVRRHDRFWTKILHDISSAVDFGRDTS